MSPMIKGGYILQPRKIDESEVSKMPPVTRELWMYLHRKVNRFDNDKLKSGQGYFRLSDIQKDLSWFVGYRREMYSKPQLTKSLRRLREGNMIETTKATHGIVVTVCNYEHYQNPKNYEGNNEGTHEGNTKETEGSQYKQESKEVKERKTINERKQDFAHLLNPFLDKYERVMLNEFFAYWTEHGENDRKMRFEKEKSFGIGRRLATWHKNQSRYGKNKSNYRKGFNSDENARNVEQILNRIESQV